MQSEESNARFVRDAVSEALPASNVNTDQESDRRCQRGLYTRGSRIRCDTLRHGSTDSPTGLKAPTSSGTFPTLSSLSLSKRTPRSPRPSPPTPLTMRILLYVIPLPNDLHGDEFASKGHMKIDEARHMPGDEPRSTLPEGWT